METFELLIHAARLTIGGVRTERQRKARHGRGRSTLDFATSLPETLQRAWQK